MKLLFLLFLLTVGCNANSLRFNILLNQQNAILRKLLNNYSSDQLQDPNLIKQCFSSYADEQQQILSEYNRQYSVCVQSAQDQRDRLAVQSLEERSNILKKSNTECSRLLDCDQSVDSLEFFNCFRTVSNESYRTFFGLHSEANTNYNKLKAALDALENELQVCTDAALTAYAKGLDATTVNLQNCLNGIASSTVPTTGIPLA